MAINCFSWCLKVRPPTCPQVLPQWDDGAGGAALLTSHSHPLGLHRQCLPRPTGARRHNGGCQNERCNHKQQVSYHTPSLVFCFQNVTVANNYFSGCGNTRYWQPNCIWAHGKLNINLTNNEITNTANGGIHMDTIAYGKDYWTDAGITNPKR